MNEVSFKAPGKLVLAGEYAVTKGHLGISIPTNHFAYAKYCPKEITNIDYDEPLVRAVMDEVQAHGLHVPKGSYIIDSSDFFNNEGKKLGLGSSSAVCTALVKLIYFLNTSFIDDNEVYKISQKAHQNFSQGLGSGIDIATAAFAKPIFFPSLTNLDIDFIKNNILFINTNTSQNTRDFLQIFNLKYDQDKTYFDNLFKESDVAIKYLLKNQEIHNIIKSFSKLANIMDQIGQKCGIDIVSKAHRTILEYAHSFGGAAKPSGAGGGDFALAVIPKEHKEGFKEAITKIGIFGFIKSL